MISRQAARAAMGLPDAEATAQQFIPDLAILDRRAVEWNDSVGKARIALREALGATRTLYGDAYGNVLERLVENLDESADSLLHAEIRRWQYRLEQANDAAREAATERDKALRAMAEQAGEINRLISAITKIDKAVTELWQRRRNKPSVPTKLADPIADGLGVAARRAHRSSTEVVRHNAGGYVEL